MCVSRVDFVMHTSRFHPSIYQWKQTARERCHSPTLCNLFHGLSHVLFLFGSQIGLLATYRAINARVG
jgi:hypothetical protein